MSATSFLKIIGTLVALIGTTVAESQESVFKYKAEVMGVATGKTVPFWFRANTYGSVPAQGISSSTILTAKKDFDSLDNFLDWSAGLEVGSNAGKTVTGNIIEGYIKLRGSIFQITFGRSKEIMGLCDTILGSGSFSESGNSLPIPKLSISIPEYFEIPGLDGLIAFKGNLAHGWIGKFPVTYDKVTNSIPTYIHQASLYARFGKPYWQIQLYGGFNHQVYWGSERITYGSQFDLSFAETLKRVALGQNWNRSKIGNQLGSIDQGIEINYDNSKIFIYHQNIYDIGALFHLANLGDGLYGLTIENKNFGRDAVSLKKIVVEVFVTKNQAGEPSSKITPSGDENYYNNDFYRQGWTYKGTAVGNPFITLQSDARIGQPNFPRDNFINNRVVVYHLGFEGKVSGIEVTTKLSFSRNFGNYGTSSFGHSLSRTREKPTGHFIPVSQFSGLLRLEKVLTGGYSLTVSTALDNGLLLYNTTGLIVGIIKNF